MPESGRFELPDLPEPDDLISGVARHLNINPDTRPTWGDQEPIDQLYQEEAPTIGGRILAHKCINELYCLVDMTEKPPEWRCDPIPTELVQETLDSHLAWAQEQWDQAEPFPSLTLTHLLGAAKRQIAWLKELRHFEETEHFDGTLGVYRSIRTLIERALRQEEV